jgi:hypothetical protein
MDYLEGSLREGRIPAIQLPRVLCSALETVKSAQFHRTVIPFGEIKADDPRLPEFYATRPPTPNTSEYNMNSLS